MRICLMVSPLLSRATVIDQIAKISSALMEDLSQTLEDGPSASAAVETLLLDLEDNSDCESDVDEDEPGDAISAARYHDMPPSSIAAPATRLPISETLHVRTGPQQVPTPGHAYDVAHSHKADHFEPSLESIAELQIVDDAESSCDEDEEAVTPEDKKSFNEQVPSALPAPPVAPGEDCAAKFEENHLAIVDIEFGATLERVASRRDAVGIVS